MVPTFRWYDAKLQLNSDNIPGNDIYTGPRSKQEIQEEIQLEVKTLKALQLLGTNKLFTDIQSEGEKTTNELFKCGHRKQ